MGVGLPKNTVALGSLPEMGVGDKLPPVVYGNGVIDRLNDALWRLPAPWSGDAVQSAQRAVVDLERRIDAE